RQARHPPSGRDRNSDGAMRGDHHPRCRRPRLRSGLRARRHPDVSDRESSDRRGNLHRSSGGADTVRSARSLRPDRARPRPGRRIGRRRPIDRVIFLVLPTVEILDLAGPLQAFAEANALSPRYAIRIVSTHPEVESAQGVRLSALEAFAPVPENSLVVVPGLKYAATERVDRRVLRWLRDAYESGATIAS